MSRIISVNAELCKDQGAPSLVSMTCCHKVVLSQVIDVGEHLSNKEDNVFKFLLLGAGESGKTTFLRQMQQDLKGRINLKFQDNQPKRVHGRRNGEQEKTDLSSNQVQYVRSCVPDVAFKAPVQKSLFRSSFSKKIIFFRQKLLYWNITLGVETPMALFQT